MGINHYAIHIRMADLLSLCNRSFLSFLQYYPICGSEQEKIMRQGDLRVLIQQINYKEVVIKLKPNS